MAANASRVLPTASGERARAQPIAKNLTGYALCPECAQKPTAEVMAAKRGQRRR